MKKSFIPKGVCANKMDIEVEDGIVKNVEIHGGCPGNLIGLSKLVTGMKVDDVIEQLDGITCGRRATSCPDQLAKALKEMIAETSK